eukprot:TRINITY_DN1071_c0_g1_i4.p1 TRINITY_DN1071_c0_g1~~TRINITY_DN1071_c0_g1_i4.p1  ORF type:complete len:103 (+),score=18.09 TRINITY_DN1071_c0_g1_i4:96-404(+)
MEEIMKPRKPQLRLSIGWDVVGVGFGVGLCYKGFAIGPGCGIGFGPNGSLGVGCGVRAGLAVGPGLSLPGLRGLSVGLVIGPAVGYGKSLGYSLQPTASPSS